MVEMNFDGYRAIPPFVEFLDPETGDAGTRSGIPHMLPQIIPASACVYNRKTYGEHSGLHKEVAVRGLGHQPRDGGHRGDAESHFRQHQQPLRYLQGTE